MYILCPVVVLLITAISIGVQLSRRRKNKYQEVMHTLFYRTPRFGAGAWGFGSWWNGAWDVGQKLNDSIAEGQARYSHARSRAHTPREKPHHRSSSNKHRHK